MTKPYYQDESATIYHGDCREIMPELPPVDVVVADPPYGMGKAEWDAAIVPVAEWLPAARDVAPVALFCGVRGMFDYPRPDWIAAWVRLGSTQRNGSLGGFNNWEPILLYDIPTLVNDVIATPNFRSPVTGGHPTPKPIKLLVALLARMPAGTVLDPFMGSGTTLVAAKNLGRKSIGIEIEERYCEIAAQRLSQGVLDLGAL